jgi:hypothetical protein
MKLYHGTNNPNFKLQSVKNGFGYYPGAGPVEFLGPSFTDNKEVAESYGKIIIEKEVDLSRPKRIKSLEALKNDIIRVFGLPQSGQNLGAYYRDIADSYKVKLLVEGFDSIIFPEGLKTSTDEKVSNTVILLSEKFFV